MWDKNSQLERIIQAWFGNELYLSCSLLLTPSEWDHSWRERFTDTLSTYRPPTELKVNKDFDIALPPVAADVRSTAVAAAAQSSGEESAPTKSSGRGRSAGKFTAGIGNIGLACLRLEQVQRWVPPGRAGEGEDGLTLTVQNAQGETLGVKPFIPKWWPESPMHDT